MLKRGRKGRVSNELVAASCAAILAVYAAGTWRTRDADRRFGEEGQIRRPARPAQVPAAPIPAAVAVPVAHSAPPTPPAAIEPKPAAKKQVKVVPAPSQPVAALPKAPEPATPAPASVPVEANPEPVTEAVVATEQTESAPAHKRWLDGYYTGWGTSRHGDLQAFVRIEDGKIVDAGVASCETRYPCDVISRILLQPVAVQGPDVDRVSRATESADAYYYGLVSALEHAEAGTFKSTRP